MRVMLDILWPVSFDFDIQFNSKKSVAMWVGTRFNVECASLIFTGWKLQFVQYIKYIGIYVPADKYF